MSLESAKKFLAEVKKNPALAKQLAGAKTQQDKEKIVKAAGYNFTQSEFNECRKGALTSEDLAKVSGGGYLCGQDIHNNCGSH